jgi:hypothetical protein
VPGPAAAAAVAAVRRAWAEGQEVVVVSPRPSAAPFVLKATGTRGIAREVARLGRRHSCDRLVLCLEPGWPLRGRARKAGTRALAAALASFRHAEVVVTAGSGEAWTDLAPSWRAAELAPLWGAVEMVTAGSEQAAASLRAAGAAAVRLCDPYEGAHLRPFPLGAVSPLEHGELLVRVRVRRLLGALARQLLGSREPALRAYLRRPLLWARRARAAGGAREVRD